MRLSSLLMCGVFAIFVPVTMTLATTAAAIAQEPTFDVDITYDIDPPEDYRLCPMKVIFTATIAGKNWPAGMSRTITYHWERGSKIYKDRTMTIDNIVNPSQSNFLRLHSEHSFRGYVRFVITKPYRHVQQSDDLDILCH